MICLFVVCKSVAVQCKTDESLLFRRVLWSIINHYKESKEVLQWMCANDGIGRGMGG